MPRIDIPLRKSSARRGRPRSSTTASGGSTTYPTDLTIVTTDDTVPNLARVATIVTVASGNWSSTSTWDLGRIPTTDDIVGIKTTHTVTYDASSTDVIAAIGVAGKLAFRPDINTQLWVKHLLIYGPAIGFSQTSYGELEIGTIATPVASGVTAQIVWPDVALDGGADPSQYGHGLLCWGKVRIHGQIRTAFRHCSTALAASATSLPFGTAVSGWVAGDRVLIPDSRPYGVVDSPWLPYRIEVKTLSAVAGDNLSATVSALTYAHPGSRDKDNVLDFTPHAADLTRNVILKSAAPDGVRGHVLFSNRADFDVRYAWFRSMGRTHNNIKSGPTNHVGRYACHIHHVRGPVVAPASGRQFVVKGCVMEDEGTDDTKQSRWGITIHDSHYGDVIDNVIYRHTGASMMGEEGNESQNVITGNFACNSTGTGTRGDAHGGGDDPGREGCGYWFMQLGNNTFSGNVSCNHTQYGFIIWPAVLANMHVPSAQGNDPDEPGEYVLQSKFPLLNFVGNESYCMGGGGTIWYVGASIQAVEATFAQSVIDQYSCWNCTLAIFMYPSKNFLFSNCKWRFGGTPALANDYVTYGYFLQDYLNRDTVISNCDIQGFRFGICVPDKVGDMTDANSNTTGLFRVEDTILCNRWEVMVRTPNGVTGGGVNLSPRRTEIDNCSFFTPSGVSDHLICFQSFLSTGDAPGINWIVADSIYFTNIQGNASDDVRVWRDEQVGSYITPSAGGVGSSESGKTNTYNLANHGVCVGGAITPDGTSTRAGFFHATVEVI